MTLKENQYVLPYTMFGDGRIPDSDIEKFGTPIGIVATQGDIIPCPGSLRYRDDWNGYQYTACANNSNVIAKITFIKMRFSLQK